MYVSLSLSLSLFVCLVVVGGLPLQVAKPLLFVVDDKLQVLQRHHQAVRALAQHLRPDRPERARVCERERERACVAWYELTRG
jgi:hypothetical protein